MRRTEERDSYLSAGDDAGEVSRHHGQKSYFHPGEYNQAWIELARLSGAPAGRGGAISGQAAEKAAPDRGKNGLPD